MIRRLSRLAALRLPLAAALLILATAATAPAANWLQQGLDWLGGKSQKTTAAPTTEEVAAGLKEALRVGSARVVEQLGNRGGFSTDPEIRIPLPQGLQRARKAIAPLGMAGYFDDLELKLNRAAEEAMPAAREVFMDAIAEMTLADVQQIYTGPEDAATQYFRRTMDEPLRERLRPPVSTSLAEVGALRSYEAAMAKYRALPFVPDVKSDLTTYVLDRSLDGVFYYLAREEAAIRENPARRTTELLKKVFGAR